MSHNKYFTPKLLALSIAAISSGVYAENDDTEVITVEGIRGSIIKSTDIKREAASVIDVITAEDVGKFPDDNVMDSLKRITGVQISRDESGTANAFQIRGMSENRVELNGRSVSGGEGEGRNVNLGDIPSELIAGLEIIKSPTADMIEGSLGATVNLKTARPLSKKDNLNSVTIKAKYGDNVEDAYGNIHALTSHKWNLGELGKFGALLSGTYNDNQVSGDVLRVNNWSAGGCGYYALNGTGTLVNQANNQCNDRYYAPANLTMLQYVEKQERSAANLTLQWVPNSNSEYILDVSYNRKEDNENRNTLVVNTMAGNNFLNPDYVSARLDENGIYTAYSNLQTTANEVAVGDYFQDSSSTTLVSPLTQFSTDSALFGSSNGQGELLKTELITVGLEGKWSLEDWAIAAELGYTSATHERHYIASGMNKWAGNPTNTTDQRLFVDDGEAVRFEGSHLDVDLTDPRLVSFNWTELNGDPINLTDPRLFNLSAVQDDGWIQKPREMSAKIDADYFIDYGHLNSIEFGVRATENIMERTERFRFRCSRNYSTGDNAFNADTDLGCQDPSISVVDLMAEYPELLKEVDGFFSKENDNGVTYLQQSNDAFFDNAAVWAEATGFADVGYEYSPNEYYKLTETTAAAYLKANLEGIVTSDMYYRANFGVRAVYTKIESLTTPGSEGATADELIAVKDSYDYVELLPSLNVALNLTDDVILRFAAAKVMVRPNFNQLKPTGSFNQFTGCQVYDATGYSGPWPNPNASSEVQELQIAQDQYLDSGQHSSSSPCPGIRPLNGNNVGTLELDPLTSLNYDLSLEHYWGEGNSTSFTLFYRDVKADIVKRNSIFQLPVESSEQALGLTPEADSPEFEHGYEGLPISVYDGIELWRVKQFENGGASTRYGVEIGYTQFLDFVPAPFDGFGVSVNYTYSDGERPDPVLIYGAAHLLDGEVIDFSDPAFDGLETNSYQDKLNALNSVVGAAKTQYDLLDQEALMPISNMSKHSGNVSLFYDKNKINARLSYNYRSSFYQSLDGQGRAEFKDDSERLDWSSGYKINKNLNVTFNIQNILREKSHNYIIDPSITSRVAYSDRIYTLGLGLKF